MAFADFRPHYLKVTDRAGNELGQVRALNESDLSLLWQKHEDAMELVFQSVTSEGVSPDLMVGAAAVAAIKVAPDMVTDLICLASGESDWDATFRAVSTMPVGMRLEILGAILRLTAESEGGLEKLLGLFRLLRPRTDP